MDSRWLTPCARGARALSVALLCLGAACGRSELGVTQQVSDQRVELDFGKVEVGQRVRESVSVPLAARARHTMQRSFSPEDVDAPRSVVLAPGQDTIKIAWRPRAPGRLDAAVVYSLGHEVRGRTQVVQFRIELRGVAVDPAGPNCADDPSAERCRPDAGGARDAGTDTGVPMRQCPVGANGVVCEDDNPCTIDTCVQGECAREPTLEGEECGPGFDCKVAHICASGSCVAVDLSRHSDGMACDGGDPCKEDGECKAGVCYASDEPRKPRILDRLPTYGEPATDAATDGNVFVFADSARNAYDVAELRDGRLEYRATVSMPGAFYVLARNPGRFLVRSTDGTVAGLDATDPLQPVLTPLPHIVPKPTRIPDGSTFKDVGYEAKWAIVGDIVLISTWTSYDSDNDDATGWETTYRQTSAPIDPANGESRSIDVHAYRMAVVGETVTWTLPGYGTDGTQAIGIMQFDPSGKRTLNEFISAPKAGELGCAFPHEIGATGNRFVTLSTEDNAGYYRVCLWQIADDPADGFQLVKARGLDEHVHGCGIEVDDQYVYFSCDTRNARGWLGELIAWGETVRFEWDDVVKGDKGLKFKNGDMISRTGGGAKTEIEAGYLWTIDDMAIAIDLDADAEPLTGPGHGRLNAILPSPDGRRALAGGFASFGVIESVPGPKPKIRFGDWRLHYPRGGWLRTDIRSLRDGTRVVSANPAMGYHRQDKAEELSASLGAGGMIELDVRKRTVNAQTYSGTRPIAFAAGRTWLIDATFMGWSMTDGEEPSTNTTFMGAGLPPIRADASGALLVSGTASGFVVFDPLLPPASPLMPISLNGTAQAPTNNYSLEYPQMMVVDGEAALVASSNGVELHSTKYAYDAVKLAFDPEQPTISVTVPEASGGKAIATYLTPEGEAWLVQLSYAQGDLTELARLKTDKRVIALAPFGTRWLLVSQDGVELADLACWPEAEE